MSANPMNIRVVSYNPARARKFNVGATAMRRGSLAKFSAGLLVPCADNDENLRVWVTLQEADANATDVLCVPLADAIVALAYTGTVPTSPQHVGSAYGITGPITLDFDNTTQKLLEVVDLDTNLQIVYATEFGISA